MLVESHVTPRKNETANGLDGTVHLRTVAALLVTMVGVVVIGVSFMVYEPIIPIGLGLAGLAVGVGGTHLWRALARNDGEQPQSRSESERTTPDAPNPDGDPVEVLKLRYARGEVGDEEFERRIERLVGLDSDDSRAEKTDDVRVRER